MKIQLAEQEVADTLALIGEWGVGKSSVMNLLRRRLEEEGNQGRFATVWFNAWEHENTGNMAAALAQGVIRGLLSGLSTWQKLQVIAAVALVDVFMGAHATAGYALGAPHRPPYLP